MRYPGEEPERRGGEEYGWSPSPDDVPDIFKPAMQALANAFRQSGDELTRLRQEVSLLRSEKQELVQANLDLQATVDGLRAEQQRAARDDQRRTATGATRAPEPETLPDDGRGRANLSAKPPGHAGGRPESRRFSFQLKQTLEGHSQPVHTVAVRTGKSDDPANLRDSVTIATGSWDKTISLLQLGDSGDPKTRTLGTGDSMGGLYSCAFSKTIPDVLGCTSADKKIYLWDFCNEKLLHTLPHGDSNTGHTDEVNGIAFHELQHVICTASDDKKALIWDFQEGVLLRTLDKHQASVYGATFLGSKSEMQYNVATCCLKGDTQASFHVFDMRDKKEVTKHEAHDDDIIGIDFCARHNILATGSDDGFIQLYDTRTWKLLQKINTNIGRNTADSAVEVKRIAFSPDGDILAAAGSNKSVLLYGQHQQSLEFQPMQDLVGHSDCVFDVAWGKDSRERNILVSASHDHTAKIWMPSV
jgi:WD40 repeat protein